MFKFFINYLVEYLKVFNPFNYNKSDSFILLELNGEVTMVPKSIFNVNEWMWDIPECDRITYDVFLHKVLA